MRFVAVDSCPIGGDGQQGGDEEERGPVGEGDEGGGGEGCSGFLGAGRRG